MRQHTPEQWERINAFIRKAKAEGCVPESYFAHVKCEIELTAWEAFGCLKAEMMSINPFVALKYAFTRKTPEIKPNKDMRKCASLALIEVAKLGQVERAQGIIKDLGANVNYVNADGETPLYHAIRRKRLGMAEMLLKQGAKNIAAKNHLDPLSLACAMDFPPAIPLFMKYGVDINAQRPFKSWNKFHLGYKTFYAYPLAVAVSQNSPQATQTLLDNGADMDLKIRPDLTIREFMETHVEDMPQKMQRVVKDALIGEKTEVLIPEVLSPEPKACPNVKAGSIHVDSITINVRVDLPLQKVATKSQQAFNPDNGRTHD